MKVYSWKKKKLLCMDISKGLIDSWQRLYKTCMSVLAGSFICWQFSSSRSQKRQILNWFSNYLCETGTKACANKILWNFRKNFVLRSEQHAPKLSKFICQEFWSLFWVNEIFATTHKRDTKLMRVDNSENGI